MSLSDSDAEAIQLFESAVEKESHGLMSDAVDLYRQAFKLNPKVDLLYRQEKVPHSISQLQRERGKNTAHRVDESVIKSINVDSLLASFEHEEARAPEPGLEADVTIKLANLTLEAAPVSPLIALPRDIWVYILQILLVQHPQLWFNFSITCKKHAYLGFHRSEIWRQLAELVYPNQVYEENEEALEWISAGLPIELPVPKDVLKILPSYKLWKDMVVTRPFVKFNGCYISVVNYYSEGARPEDSLSWLNPVRTVTYYRYLRFYPDGKVLKVLSVLEPNQVVPHLHRSRTSLSSTELPRHARDSYRIYHGRWTISTEEDVVRVIIDEGLVPYYRFHYLFQVKSLGGIYHHGRLSWLRYYAVRKKMSDDDDREGEVASFSLGNETAFKFSRVASYTDKTKPT